MKREFRTAFNRLKKLGVPVYEHHDDRGNFSIDLEAPSEPGITWANYYDGWAIPEWDFGINPQINEVLHPLGLHAEWINPGRLGIFD
jgi:hypothetical protein